MNLNEQRDLNIYKLLLPILNDYVQHFPGTPVSTLLEKCMNEGLKVISKDTEVQKVLEGILNSDKAVPAKVQELLHSKIL